MSERFTNNLEGKTQNGRTDIRKANDNNALVRTTAEPHGEFGGMASALFQRSQRLATRLRQAENCMGNVDVNTSVEELSVVQEQAKQFVRVFVGDKELQKQQYQNQQLQQEQIQQAKFLQKPLYNASIIQQQYQISATMQCNNMNINQPRALPTLSKYMPVVYGPQYAAQFALQTSTPPFYSNNMNELLPERDGQVRKRTKVSKDALSLQVDALQQLIHMMANVSPEVNSYALRLIQQNEVLAQMDWATNSNTGGLDRCTTKLKQAHQQARRMYGGCENATGRARLQQISYNNSRIRYDSEKSNTSTGSKKQHQARWQQTQQPGSSIRRNSKKRSRKSRTSKSEQIILVNYINRIVQAYVGTKVSPELVFNGTVYDLEAHACRLVAAGYGRIVEDQIRINRKNNHQSFVNMTSNREALEHDGIILERVARRYAFEGDTVRAFVLNAGGAAKSGEEGSTNPIASDEDNSDESQSQDSDADNVTVLTDNCPKAFVISIVKESDRREIVGTISFNYSTILDDSDVFYPLKPYDSRIPIVYIPEANCALHAVNHQRHNEVEEQLYLTKIVLVNENGHCIGNLIRPVGRVGQLDDELKAILIHNNLHDIVPYEERFNTMYAEPAPAITAKDLEERLDMRHKCVFSIDPLTARDLDDALSIEQVNARVFEVGVHISDVSHYLQENTELDNIVKGRSTSIYLVNSVIHMLPQPLCMRCSLLPDQDKFAFSVFFKISVDGELQQSPRFTRTVIRSCAQFAYEHAQSVIDNPHQKFDHAKFPAVVNGHKLEDIVTRILWLHDLASAMRKKRFDNGALTVSNPKLSFTLDPLNGEPQAYQISEQREANFMIEEFMLLANQAVARFIYDAYPNLAVLRNHPPPLMKSMKSLREKLHSVGLDLDYSSSKAIQQSIERFCETAHDYVAMSTFLSQLLMKPMARANYFCSEGKSEGADLWHYALSIPIYTHFTSPIRRYPDIMVHRLLAAALAYAPPPSRTPSEVQYLTTIANERKYNAKLANDDVCNLYFRRYLQKYKVLYMYAVVMEIFQYMMNVVTLDSGHIITINYKMQKMLVNASNAPNFVTVSDRNSNMPPFKIQLLSVIPIRLLLWDNKITGFLLSNDQIHLLNGPYQPKTIKDIQKQSKQKQIKDVKNTANSSEQASGQAQESGQATSERSPTKAEKKELTKQRVQEERQAPCQAQGESKAGTTGNTRSQTKEKALKRGQALESKKKPQPQAPTQVQEKIQAQLGHEKRDEEAIFEALANFSAEEEGTTLEKWQSQQERNAQDEEQAKRQDQEALLVENLKKDMESRAPQHEQLLRNTHRFLSRFGEM